MLSASPLVTSDDGQAGVISTGGRSSARVCGARRVHETCVGDVTHAMRRVLRRLRDGCPIEPACHGVIEQTLDLVFR
jgi:hypothetical protein